MADPELLAGPDPAPVRRPADVEALRLAEQRLRVLFDSIDEGFCLCEMVLDGAGTPVDYRFLQINPLFEEMTGLVDPVGRTALELVPELEPIWVHTYARVGLGGETVRFEQGSTAMGRWFDVFAVPMEPAGHFAIVFKDRTAEHVAQQALQESELRFRTMTDQLPLSVWQHDAEGRRTWVNDRFCAFFGVAREQACTEGWHLPEHPDDNGEYERTMTRAMAERMPFHAEGRFRRSDGRWRRLETWARPLTSEDGVYLGHLGVSIDVTERVVAEEGLRAGAARDAYRSRLRDLLSETSGAAAVTAVAARLLRAQLGVSGVSVGLLGGSVRPAVFDHLSILDAGPHSAGTIDDLRAGTPVVVAGVDAGDRPAATTPEVGAYVLMPILGPDSAVAVLSVQERSPRAWTSDDVGIIADTAERTRVSLERAGAERQAEIRQARAELLADVVYALEREVTADAQLRLIPQLLVPGFADYATLEIPARAEPVLALAHRDPAALPTLHALRTVHRLQPGDANSISRAAAGEAQLLSTVTPAVQGEYAIDADTAALLREIGPRSHMAVPIDIGGGEKAALMVGVSQADRAVYRSDDLLFLKHLVQRVEAVLVASRLRRQEHDIAVRLQRALLPDQLVRHPYLEIEARYQAASAMLEVGGDWYDSFSWPDGQVGVIVGDVVGHSIDSAAAMGRLRAATAALVAHVPPSPAAVLDALQAFVRGPDGTTYVTAACAVIDPDLGILAYSSAGHPPMILQSPGGEPVRLDDARTPAMGNTTLARTVGTRPESSIVVPAGAVVVMYSDGLVERRHEVIDVGLARLEQAVQTGIAMTTSGLADQLLTELTLGSPPDDDVVVVCLRYVPGEVPQPGAR